MVRLSSRSGIAVTGNHAVSFHLPGTKRFSALRRTGCCIALSLLSAGFMSPAKADDIPVPSLQSSKRNQFWFNFGGLSQHFENSSRFNQQNFGFGLEYQVDRARYLVLGEYQNSVHGSTRYAGGGWMPLTYGPFKIGAIAGVADGYPKMRGGRFFPIILPVMAIETKYVGANFVIMPSVAGKVSGCVAMQLKLRFQ
jgi:hypothetical protein